MKGGFLPPRPGKRAALLHRDREVSPTRETESFWMSLNHFYKPLIGDEEVIGKNVVIAVLLSCLMLVVMLIGCGEDADEPSAEDLVGTWGPVVPRGETPNDAVQLTEVVFGADSALFWKVHVKGEEDGVAFKIDVTMRGTYVVSGLSLTFVGKSVETKADFTFPPPTEEIESEVLIGLTKELSNQAKTEIEQDFESENWNGTWRLAGDILTLTRDDGTEIVLRRK